MIEERDIEAYVDGELPADRRRAVEAAIAADPAAAARVKAHRQLGTRLADAFDGVIDEPVPPQLVAAARRKKPPFVPVRLGPPAWAAMAASLAIGFVLARSLAPEPLVESRGGRLVANGLLETALQRDLAGDAGARPIRIGLSFRARDGRYCRTFGGEQLQGLACRADGRWAIELAARAPPSPAPDYRQAGVRTAPAVLAAVDALIDGPPLDAAGERAARDRTWTAP